jgi:hypothetical protein
MIHSQNFFFHGILLPSDFPFFRASRSSGLPVLSVFPFFRASRSFGLSVLSAFPFFQPSADAALYGFRVLSL